MGTSSFHVSKINYKGLSAQKPVVRSSDLTYKNNLRQSTTKVYVHCSRNRSTLHKEIAVILHRKNSWGRWWRRRRFIRLRGCSKCRSTVGSSPSGLSCIRCVVLRILLLLALLPLFELGGIHVIAVGGPVVSHQYCFTRFY